jgi:hypothetical protein
LVGEWISKVVRAGEDEVRKTVMERSCGEEENVWTVSEDVDADRKGR